MKLFCKIAKGVAMFFCLCLITYGLLNLNTIESSGKRTDETLNNIQNIVHNTPQPEETDGIRERDPFGTDYGEDYYWGLDNDIDIDVEIKESTTLNEKGSGNYYMDIDFDAVKEEYPNTIAYLKVNGTGVEYPIVQGEDNDFYLKHSIDDSNNSLGWPFMDYRADPDKMLGNTTIYGHNIKNGGIFGELHKLLDNKKWFDEDANKEIYFVTEDKTYVYKIFSVYNTSPNFNYFKAEFNTAEDFDNFFNIVSDKNKVDNLEGIACNQILTLSTCYNSGRQRLVIHAYLERSKDR